MICSNKDSQPGNLRGKAAVRTGRESGLNTQQIIVLAADTAPLAILLHLPLLCEDKNVSVLLQHAKYSPY